MHIQDLIPAIRNSESSSSSDLRSTESIRHYELPPQTRTLLPAVNDEGLRVHRGRIYAEVQYTTTTTVMVDWDDGVGTYRAKLPQEVQPSGPALHFDAESNTWRVGDPQNTRRPAESPRHRQIDHADDSLAQALLPQPKQTPQPQADTAVVYIDTRHYVWDNAATNHHGYIVMHRKMRLDESVGPLSHHAFMDESGAFVRIEPPIHSIDQPADLLPAWTDRDIWDLYGLQGTEITRFRTEAHSTGKKPQWARVRPQRMENAYLYEELRRWLGPEMDRDMFNRLLEHQKLTPAKWAEHLESVTLHRSTPAPQTPLPRLPTPDTSRKTNATPAYGDQRYYTWNLDKSNFHGYVEMQRKPGLDDNHGPLTQVAFRQGSELTIVRATGYSVYKETVFRPFWRDIDIWNLYRIEGPDIVRFRQEVALTGKPPGWITQREYPSRREQLIDYLRLWTNPYSPLKSQEEVIARFQPYNLSTLQLARLCNEISPTGQFKSLINDDVPTWVKTHQVRTQVVTDSKHFEPFLPEIRDEIIRLRNQGEGTSLLKASLTAPFFRELLQRSGFKRNKYNFLYRDDIPAVFKVDDQTPFELARPGTMRPKTVSTEGSTSRSSVSGMFSLRTAMDFANEVKGVTPTSNSQSQDPSTGNESGQTRRIVSPPNAQRILFCYLLDTRGVEVVPGQDNRVYNPERIKLAGAKAWFPSMKMEGHVSMSPIGFTSRRVWLVNSGMTRAATVDDIYIQALARATASSQPHAETLEARTRAGDLNRDEYDVLIDDVAKAGKRILELPVGKDIFSNDIVFPPETITL
ncbi:hypothetical protein [Pseudomonas sp. HS6]|uniref:hypothetical protein n=1 Tax=Pseudomonas sp. HS6 TaxID=2850559 RepID=UPI0020188E69|nr:hypothetical protein [Pseudomonas sp. HS6]UQS14000.1 hypothetical protein JJN09_22660 [Pseudomonas sp. HS6]